MRTLVHGRVGPERTFTLTVGFALAVIGLLAGFLTVMGLTVEERAVTTRVEAVAQGPAALTTEGYAIPVAYAFQDEARRNILYSPTPVDVAAGDSLMLALDEDGQIRNPEGWGVAVLWGMTVFAVFTGLSVGVLATAMRLTR